MSDLFEGLKKNCQDKNVKIVFPEGLDERILKAAGRLGGRKSIDTDLDWEYRTDSGKSKGIGVSLEEC